MEAQQSPWTKDERIGASFTQQEIFIPQELIDTVMKNVLTKLVIKEIEDLKKEVEALKAHREMIVSKSEAKIIITKVIEQFKSNGLKEIDIIDLHNKTLLPFSQINNVMDELEKEGKVTEDGEEDNKG